MVQMIEVSIDNNPYSSLFLRTFDSVRSYSLRCLSSHVKTVVTNITHEVSKLHECNQYGISIFPNSNM